jgi:hypothetical protein
MRILASLLLLAVAVPAWAQEQEIRSANLSRALELELLRMYDGGATRYEGPATIPASGVVRGSIAALGDTLRIAGRVEGSVAMVNGDVVLEPGSVVTGDITVIGGRVAMDHDAEVGGTVTSYALSWGDMDARDRAERRRGSRYWDRGYSHLTVRVGASYNRVEGLPVMFGPVLHTGGANPFRLEALAIWRSEAGASLDGDRMGYRVRAEQLLAGRGQLSVGGSAYSVIDPMDPWQLGDLEASLAAVLFHLDYRDHYERQGWSAFARLEPVRGLAAKVAYRQEDHMSVPVADPWSLFNGGDLWRAQPVIGEGEVRAVTGSLELDLRDDADAPLEGWLARLTVDRPVGGSLRRPELFFVRPEGGEPITELLPAADLDLDFTTVLMDVRRYMPVGYGSQLGLRLAAGGAVEERPLPPQFQHALGGMATLPGFAPFYADCGARLLTGRYAGHRYYTGYGCDRFVLGQAEYRGDLSLGFGFGDRSYDEDHRWWKGEVDADPRWVIFFDAGQGWAYGSGLSGTETTTGMLYDAGIGLLLGELGIYAALPLNGELEREPRFFIRLDRRF